MDLLTLVITLVVVGVVLWLVNTYVPMEARIKKIVNIVVLVVVVLWLLRVFGVLDSGQNIRTSGTRGRIPRSPQGAPRRRPPPPQQMARGGECPARVIAAPPCRDRPGACRPGGERCGVVAGLNEGGGSSVRGPVAVPRAASVPASIGRLRRAPPGPRFAAAGGVRDPFRAPASSPGRRTRAVIRRRAGLQARGQAASGARRRAENIRDLDRRGRRWSTIGLDSSSLGFCRATRTPARRCGNFAALGSGARGPSTSRSTGASASTAVPCGTTRCRRSSAACCARQSPWRWRCVRRGCSARRRTGSCGGRRRWPGAARLVRPPNDRGRPRRTVCGGTRPLAHGRRERRRRPKVPEEVCRAILLLRNSGRAIPPSSPSANVPTSRPPRSRSAPDRSPPRGFNDTPGASRHRTGSARMSGARNPSCGSSTAARRRSSACAADSPGLADGAGDLRHGGVDLDNAYIIQGQIDDVRQHLPKNTASAPGLASEPGSGGQGSTISPLGWSGMPTHRLDRAGIEEFLSAYQSIVSLTMGELWAAPLMLRIALLDATADSPGRSTGGCEEERADFWANRLLHRGAARSRPDVRHLAELAREMPEPSAPISPSAHRPALRCGGGTGRRPKLAGADAGHKPRGDRRPGGLPAGGRADLHRQRDHEPAAALEMDWREIFERQSRVEALLLATHLGRLRRMGSPPGTGTGTRSRTCPATSNIPEEDAARAPWRRPRMARRGGTIREFGHRLPSADRDGAAALVAGCGRGIVLALQWAFRRHTAVYLSAAGAAT